MAAPLISVSDARALVLDRVTPQPPQSVAVAWAQNRVLAEPVHAAADTPPFPSSAMDGYALAAGPAGRRLTLVGESRAGRPSDRAPGPQEAIRVSTGAAVPDGAEAVIPQENVTVDGDVVTTNTDVAAGQHIRRPGEDMRAGAEVLPAGTRLNGIGLGAVVAAGRGEVTVSPRPHVAVLCTGDELRAPGEPLGPGEIHNSNALMLAGLAASAGAIVDEPERLPDDREATLRGIERAIERAGVVVISGGVSVGPHDHVKPALAELGVGEVFWSVALQPGKPTWFGVSPGGALVFGLPGNPVSAAVTYSLFVAPALNALQGLRDDGGFPAEAVLGHEVRRNPRREMALRVRLERGEATPVAIVNGAQGSHVLSSLVGADALAMIAPGEGNAAAGTRVGLMPLAG
ncbi:MAG TPA: gephyrin-like molybdotransferase Glp [Solirubrobacteraceae bacterium]|nr:gephyrin-like molybdotransferase Glp [Solirubrobacteraceae bacterium]